MKKIALLWLFVWLGGFIAFGQNPQSSTAPIYAANAKYVNGVAPGYYPTQQAVGSLGAQTGLHINVGPGTANCSGTIITYAGGTFTMTASTVNYIYLNTASSCAVAVKTTSYTSSDIPVAMVTAGVSTLSSIVDDRTIFNVPGAAGTTVNSFNTRTGAVTLTAADVNGVGGITNSTSGNAATATQLASAPTVCSGGQVPTGVDAHGNAVGCSTPSGSGVQYNPTNTLYLWAGPDSIVGDDGGAYNLGTAIPMVGWTQSAGVCSFHSTGAHNLVVDEWFSTDQVGGFPAPPSPFAPWTTGLDLFQVATVPDSTHWTASCPLISAASGSGGNAENANFFLPFYTASLPFFNGHGSTQVVLPVGSTLVSMAANYSTVIHPRITAWQGANPGAPIYVLITGLRNDIQGCTSEATLKTDLLTVAANIHTDGAQVIFATITPNPWNTSNLGCHTAFVTANDLNNWAKTQLKNNTNSTPNCTSACGQYFDRVLDPAGTINNLNNSNLYNTSGDGSLSANGHNVYGNIVNAQMSTQASTFGSYPDNLVAGPQGGSLVPGFGVTHIATSSGKFAESWWNTAGTGLLFGMDGGSGPYFPLLTSRACIGTDSAGYPVTGSCGGTTTNALTFNNGGAGDASGSSFNGSASKTLSYNSIGAAPTVSPVLTGTPDASGASQFKLPVAAAFASLANGEIGYDSTNKNWHAWGNAVDNIIPLVPVASLPSNGNCVQWTVTAGVYTLTQAAGPCGTSSGTVTVTGSPVSGNLTKFSGVSSITNGDLSGDATTSGTLAVTIVKVNGGSIPVSAVALASNGSSQLIAATLAGAGAGLTTGPVSGTTANDFATMNGTDGRIKDSGVLITAIPAANIASGALANGMTATTQSAASNDTKVATDAYVDGHFIANGTSAMGTSAIASGACATVVTTAATGTAATDVIVYTPNADPTGITGYAVSATGSLYIWAYPTTNNVNFKVCNNTSGSLTPGALTLNWKVTR